MEQAFGLSIPRTVAQACDPGRLALLVYDMQVGVLGQISNADQVTASVVRTVDAARAGGYRVFYLRHMGIPNEVSGVTRLRMAMAWQRTDRVADVHPVFLRGSAEFALTPALAPSPAEMIFDKVTMSAFVGTPLDLVLRDCGINSFAICGVATEVGIDPTVRHAADLGYLPIVVSDACGAGNAAAAERAIEGLRFAGDALITDTDTLCPLLAGDRSTGSGAGPTWAPPS
ncbi:MAG TPA: isochorismatase family cysteine hydrolase [Pseudonocardia sp.]|jgi:nicotinamidase-related amidase|uniref:cysteine hydrolase family protein n=1 Tax=Pseudonocardia sp. TaxID=60912 RepID=UPI002F40C33E